METAQHIQALRHEGDLLAAAASDVEPEAQVPTCPGWQLRDLVRHVGGVHRWAADNIAAARAKPLDRPLEEITGGWPDDVDLVDWYRDGHAKLVQTLSDADPDLVCFAFLPAPSPLSFWARRQALEAAMHRVDAQSCLDAITPFAPELALDGIDEMLFGFAQRPFRTPRTAPDHRMHLRAADVERDWVITLTRERVEAVAQPDGAWTAASDCTVEGSASDLFLLLWNRPALDGLTVSGDPAVLGEWREAIRIRWVE